MPTYSFAVGAFGFALATDPRTSGAVLTPQLQCLSLTGVGAGDACGGTSVPLFARSSGVPSPPETYVESGGRSRVLHGSTSSLVCFTPIADKQLMTKMTA